MGLVDEPAGDPTGKFLLLLGLAPFFSWLREEFLTFSSVLKITLMEKPDHEFVNSGIKGLNESVNAPIPKLNQSMETLRIMTSSRVSSLTASFLKRYPSKGMAERKGTPFCDF